MDRDATFSGKEHTTSWQRIKRSVNHFCWFCAGVKTNFVDALPTEHVKYAGIGITVFITGLLAALSGGYAFYTVFRDHTLCITFAAIWGLIIFFLDRYIVSSIRKQGRPGKEFVSALPRFLIAIVISFVVSNPIELKLFEKEINLQMKEDLAGFQKKQTENSANTLLIKSMENEKAILKEKADVKSMKLSNLRDTLTSEIQGLLKSGLKGDGPAARSIKKNIESSSTELQNLNDQAGLLSLRIDSLRGNRNTEVSALMNAKIDTDSFLARNIAFAEIRSKNPFAQLTFYLLALLILLLETAPIIVKLISSKGAYDHLVESMEALKEREYREITAAEVDKTLEAVRKMYSGKLRNFDLLQEEIMKIRINNQEDKKVENHLREKYFSIQKLILDKIEKNAMEH